MTIAKLKKEHEELQNKINSIQAQNELLKNELTVEATNNLNLNTRILQQLGKESAQAYQALKNAELEKAKAEKLKARENFKKELFKKSQDFTDTLKKLAVALDELDALKVQAHEQQKDITDSLKAFYNIKSYSTISSDDYDFSCLINPRMTVFTYRDIEENIRYMKKHIKDQLGNRLNRSHFVFDNLKKFNFDVD